MVASFHDAIIDRRLVSRFGPALHSGRPLFIYGPAGAGKSFIASRLIRALPDDIWVPFAIYVDGLTLMLFDPEYHTPVAGPGLGPRLDRGHDPRYVHCRRPLVTVGGELTLDMLEVQYAPLTRRYQAPVQMRANNGVFVLDDLGRQRASAQAILNRWIVPMEERRDLLHTATGAHFAVPFDVVLVFATNLDPTDLADEAILRRIGYKIPLGELTEEQYTTLWQRVCTAQPVECPPPLIRHVIRDLHRNRGVPLLACHPRDLVGLATDRIRYEGRDSVLNEAVIDWAWENYFVPVS
jgi:hypothetical protein